MCKLVTYWANTRQTLFQVGQRYFLPKLSIQLVHCYATLYLKASVNTKYSLYVFTWKLNDKDEIDNYMKPIIFSANYITATGVASIVFCPMSHNKDLPLTHFVIKPSYYLVLSSLTGPRQPSVVLPHERFAGNGWGKKKNLRPGHHLNSLPPPPPGPTVWMHPPPPACTSTPTHHHNCHHYP